MKNGVTLPQCKIPIDPEIIHLVRLWRICDGVEGTEDSRHSDSRWSCRCSVVKGLGSRSSRLFLEMQIRSTELLPPPV